MSFKAGFVDYTVSEQAINLAIVSIVTIQVVYFTLIIIGLIRIGSYQGIQQADCLFRMIALFRLVISKVLFLPIFQVLSFPVTCSYYEEKDS